MLPSSVSIVVVQPYVTLHILGTAVEIILVMVVMIFKKETSDVRISTSYSEAHAGIKTRLYHASLLFKIYLFLTETTI